MSEEIQFKKLKKNQGSLRPRNTDIVRLTRTTLSLGRDAARKIYGKEGALPKELIVSIEYNIEKSMVRVLKSDDISQEGYLIRASTQSSWLVSMPAALRSLGIPYGIYIPLPGHPSVYKLDISFANQNDRRDKNKKQF